MTRDEMIAKGLVPEETKHNGHRRAHFHDYNKTWWLDAEITEINLFEVNQSFLDDVGDEVNAQIGDAIFVISLGKVLGTNLEEKK